MTDTTVLIDGQEVDLADAMSAAYHQYCRTERKHGERAAEAEYAETLDAIADLIIIDSHEAADEARALHCDAARHRRAL